MILVPKTSTYIEKRFLQDIGDESKSAFVNAAINISESCKNLKKINVFYDKQDVKRGVKTN